MKKLIVNKKGKRKSLDLNYLNNLKNRVRNNEDLNNTFTNHMSSLFDDIIRKRKIKKEDISILSNANLDILKSLSTYAKEEKLNINNSSDFPSENKNKFFNLKSLNSLTKLKKKIINDKNSLKQKPKKIIIKKNISAYSSNINASELSLNSHKIINNLKIQEKYSLKKNKSIKKRKKRNSVVLMTNNYLSKAFIDDIKEEKLFNLKKITNKNLEMNYEMKTKVNYEQFMNETLSISFKKRILHAKGC